MANQDQAGQALEQAKKPTTITEMIQTSAKELGKAMPAHMNPERMVRIALTAIRLNPKLTQCTPESFLGSLFVLAQIGLEPIAGQAYLLPFRNNRKVGNNWRSTMEVQALIGYKGMAALFYRHESSLTIDMQTVCANDEFDYEYGTGAFLRHKPALGDRGPATGYYAIATMKGGASKFHFMSKDQCLEHGKKHSKVYDKNTGKFMPKTPWVDDVDAMCMKTVLIQLAKLLPRSVELQRAIAVDETSREYRTGIKDALSLPDTTNWGESPEEAQVVPEKKLEQKKEEKKDQPSAKTKIADNIVGGLAQVQKKLGNDKFFRILGNAGYTDLTEVPNTAEATKILNAALKEVADGK